MFFKDQIWGIFKVRPARGLLLMQLGCMHAARMLYVHGTKVIPIKNTNINTREDAGFVRAEIAVSSEVAFASYDKRKKRTYSS